jgi:hypothetical protein
MLAYLLAIAVGLGSFALYVAAFFFPEIHRKDDFLWSGVGLFYALVLWVCAGRITGGVLLGQVAGISLLGWFVWETVVLRRAIARPEERTEALQNFSVTEAISNQLGKISSIGRKKPKPQVKTDETAATISPKPETSVTAVLETPVETEKEESTPEIETTTEAVLESSVESLKEESAAAEIETPIEATLENILEEGIEESTEDEDDDDDMDTVIEDYIPTPVENKTEKNLTPQTETAAEAIATPQKKITTQKKKGFLGNIVDKIASPFRKKKTEPKTTTEPVVASLSNVDLETASSDTEIVDEAEISQNIEDVATEVESETVAIKVTPLVEIQVIETKTETQTQPEITLEETAAELEPESKAENTEVETSLDTEKESAAETETTQIETSPNIEIEVTKISIKATSEQDLEELAAEIETEIDRVESFLDEEEEETQATTERQDDSELAEFVSELEAEPETDTIEVEIISATVEEVVSEAENLPETIAPKEDESEIKKEVEEPTSPKKPLPDYSLLKELDFDRDPETDEEESDKD